jgi:CubicO group peptidase (beta-lactamase class C family)
MSTRAGRHLRWSRSLATAVVAAPHRGPALRRADPTAGDYLRFAQMLASGGGLDGERVLSRTTIKHMTADHLGSRIALAPTPGDDVLGAQAYTFGLGFAVRPSDGIAAVPGSADDYNWGGYAGTAFWVDPGEHLVAVFMVQSGGPLRTYHRTLFRQLVYQAIVD